MPKSILTSAGVGGCVTPRGKVAVAEGSISCPHARNPLEANSWMISSSSDLPQTLIIKGAARTVRRCILEGEGRQTPGGSLGPSMTPPEILLPQGPTRDAVGNLDL